MINGNLVLGMVAASGVLTTLFFFVSLIWVTRRRRDLPVDFTPPVTIFKPLKGVDEGLEENLRSFFRLDYPEYQLLFGVAEADDPAIPIVRRLLKEYPEHDASLVVGCPTFGLNPKIENVASMDRFRKHETILVSDSNVRVRPSYVRETVAYLADPSVGLVTNLFSGVGEQRTGGALENLQINGFIVGGFSAASALGITCVVGKSMVMPIRALEAIGGWASVRNLLCEDQTVAMKVRKAGYAVRLSHHVVENVNESRGWKWFLSRHSRWYKVRRQLALPAFLMEPLSNLPAIGLVWALCDDTGLAWGGLVVLSGLSMLRDAAQTRVLRGTFPRLRHLALSPIKDLLLLPIWFDALFNRRVFWRGHRFLIGRWTRIRRGRVPLSVRRRVRRVRRLRMRQAH
jgi:ceramide glucosyltransferase